MITSSALQCFNIVCLLCTLQLFLTCSVTTGSENADGLGMCLQIESIVRNRWRKNEGPLYTLTDLNVISKVPGSEKGGRGSRRLGSYKWTSRSDFLEDSREGYQNCSVLYYVLQLFPRSYEQFLHVNKRAFWFRFMFNFKSLCNLCECFS